MRIADILQQFSEGNYKPGSPQREITLESKKLIEESIFEIIDFYIEMTNKFSDDMELTITFFNSAFVLGRLYERKLNDPSQYN